MERDDARWGRWALPLAGAMLLLDLTADPSVHVHVAVLFVSSALLVWASWSGRVDRRWLLLAFVPLAFAAVARVPNGTDLWSYQAYGRVLGVHHANPYTTTPSAFPNDPVTARVNDLYRDTPSAYGPVFTVGAAGIAAATGTDETVGRVAWQSLAVLAVLATLLVLRRHGAPMVALAVYALHPVTLEEVMHLAHNDALVGLCVLGGCLLTLRTRTVPAALLLTAAALIKAPAALALVALLSWLVSRGERRAAAVTAGIAVGCTAVLLAPFGIGTALEAMLESSPRINATSFWNLARGDWQMFVHDPVVTGSGVAGTTLRLLSVLVPVSVAVAAGVVMRRRPAHEVITVALLAWMVFGLAPASWYLAWMLPLVALWDPPQRTMLVAFTCLVQVTSQAWLMPVAALITTGHLVAVDRAPAMLLGIATVSGVWLLSRLIRPTGAHASTAAVVP